MQFAFDKDKALATWEYLRPLVDSGEDALRVMLLADLRAIKTMSRPIYGEQYWIRGNRVEPIWLSALLHAEPGSVPVSPEECLSEVGLWCLRKAAKEYRKHPKAYGRVCKLLLPANDFAFGEVPDDSKGWPMGYEFLLRAVSNAQKTYEYWAS